MGWLKKHWKKLLGTACGVVVVAVRPRAPALSDALAAVCAAAFTSDFHAGETLGRLGADALNEKRRVDAEKKAAKKAAKKLPKATVDKQ